MKSRVVFLVGLVNYVSVSSSLPAEVDEAPVMQLAGSLSSEPTFAKVVHIWAMASYWPVTVSSGYTMLEISNNRDMYCSAVQLNVHSIATI